MLINLWVHFWLFPLNTRPHIWKTMLSFPRWPQHFGQQPEYTAYSYQAFNQPKEPSSHTCSCLTTSPLPRAQHILLSTQHSEPIKIILSFYFLVSKAVQIEWRKWEKTDRLTDTNKNNICHWHRKQIYGGTFLAVQPLRLLTSNAGGRGSIPGQETKIPHAMQQYGQNINT